MYCLSINYKNADVEIRKKFSYSPEVRREIAQKLLESGASECVLLCTCNRTELYFCGAADCTEKAVKLLAMYGNADRKNMSRFVRMYYGEKAAVHLFRVACGIDSMIIGEDEILGQVKYAYHEAMENHTVRFELNTIFQSAVACAKKIKTETGLSKTPVSAATLAANEAAGLSEKVDVLIIGSTGKTGSSVLKNLIPHKNVTVTRTIRQVSHRNITYYPQVNNIDYSERYKFMNKADCIISATSSPHYTVIYKELAENLTVSKPRLFIDLAVPPDIDSQIAEIPETKIIGIDYFRRLAEYNNNIKLSSAEEAEEIIASGLDEMQKKLVFHEFLPFIDEVRENISGMPFENLLYKLKEGLDSHQLSAVLEIMKGLD